MRRFAVVASIGILLAFALLAPYPATAALERPAYAAGDRWVYELSASFDSLAGLNDTTNATVSLALSARVVIEVRGLVERQIGSTTVRGVEASMRTTGFLNGTFEIPEVPLPGILTGTFTSDGSEVWEDDGYLAIETHEETAFDMQVTFVVSTPLTIRVRSNASTSVVHERPFPLDVGNRTTASLETELQVNTTVVVFGMEASFENRTAFESTWSREVLSREPVSVDAGTFDAYRLNQTLVAFPGLSIGAGSAGGNETAWWSNGAGNYVKRTAYVNGTPVAETRLNSYSYGPAPGFPILPVTVGLIVVVAGVVALLWFRRRKAVGASRPSKGSNGGNRSAPESSPREGGDRAR